MKKNSRGLIVHPGLKHPRRPRHSTPPVKNIPKGYIATREIADKIGRSSVWVIHALNRLKVKHVRCGHTMYWEGEGANEYIQMQVKGLYDSIPEGYVDVATALESTGLKSPAYLTTLFKRGKVQRVRYRDDSDPRGRRTRFAYNLVDLLSHLGLDSSGI